MDGFFKNIPLSVRPKAGREADADATATAVPQTAGKEIPKRKISFGSSLHDLASDYTDRNPFFTALGGTGDAAIAAAWVYPPTRPEAILAEKAASALYNAPRAADLDYWKKAGKDHRDAVKNMATVPKEANANQMNKLRSDFISTFLVPPKVYGVDF
jgi:hypothetical protein